jgi:hypothetical protein
LKFCFIAVGVVTKVKGRRKGMGDGGWGMKAKGRREKAKGKRQKGER